MKKFLRKISDRSHRQFRYHSSNKIVFYSTTLPFNPLGEDGDPVTYRPDKTIQTTVMICGLLTIRATHGRTISSGYQ
ncbi:hypothetical protein AIZ10_23420, partial [Salmonella enterica subsp. enterica serovar Typhimurium]